MFFLNKKDEEKIAEKLAAKLSSAEEDIPEKLQKKISRCEFAAHNVLIKKYFKTFTPPVQAKLRLLLEDCGYLDYLLSNLESNKEKTVVQGLELLGILTPKKAFGNVYKCLQDKRAAVNFAAAQALINFQEQRTVQYLIAELERGTNKILPARIADILVGLAAQAVPELINRFEKMPPKTQKQVIEIFAETGDKRTLPLLEKALLDAPSEVRVQAALALGEIGGASSMTILEKVLKSHNLTLRKYAQQALQQIAAAREGDD